MARPDFEDAVIGDNDDQTAESNTFTAYLQNSDPKMPVNRAKPVICKEK